MIWLLLLLGCGGRCDAPGVLCTVAGTGTNGFSLESAPASETPLYFPSALDVHDDGRVLLADFNNFVIRALGPDDTLEIVAGNNTHAFAVEGPARESPLENPIDLAAAPDGGFYVAELHAGRILRIRDGVVEIVAGTGEIGHRGDGGPAIDAALSEACGVAGADDGTVYVADTDNDRLRAVGPDGVIDTVLDGLSAPQRLHWEAPFVYVADTGNHRIVRFDPRDGAVDVIAGTGSPGWSGDGGPASQALLSSPHGVTVGPDGAVFIADSGNHVVRRVDPDGTIETVAGTGEAGYDDGRPALRARLDWPVDVLVHEGDLYVADMRNGAVRRIREGAW